MDLNDKISRSSLHIEVADRVRDMIFDRSLTPGHRIDELDLSAKLGTSRTPLREALKVLANEGLVRLAPGRGAYVTELAPQEVDSLFPVLAMLEARCAGEAVRRLSAADLRRLELIHQKMEAHMASGDAAAYHHAADDLHHQLHLIARNPWLLRATSDLRRFLRLARGMTPQTGGRLLQSLAEHRTLMKSISRRDADSAEQVMHHHLLAQQKAWRTGIVQQQAAAGSATPAAASGSSETFDSEAPPASEASDTPAASVPSAGQAGDPASAPPAPQASAAPTATARGRAATRPEAETLGV